MSSIRAVLRPRSAVEEGRKLTGNPKAGKQGGRDAFVLWVRARPRARKDEVLGFGEDGFLEIHVKAVPERGEANRSCRRELARLLGIPASQISLEKGHGSVHKKFLIEGMGRQDGKRALEQALSRGRNRKDFAIRKESL